MSLGVGLVAGSVVVRGVGLTDGSALSLGVVVLGLGLTAGSADFGLSLGENTSGFVLGVDLGSEDGLGDGLLGSFLRSNPLGLFSVGVTRGLSEATACSYFWLNALGPVVVFPVDVTELLGP